MKNSPFYVLLLAIVVGAMITGFVREKANTKYYEVRVRTQCQTSTRTLVVPANSLSQAKERAQRAVQLQMRVQVLTTKEVKK